MSDAWSRFVASITITGRSAMESLDLVALSQLPASRQAEAVSLLVDLLLRGDPRAVAGLMSMPGGPKALRESGPRIPPSEALVEAARALGGRETTAWVVSALQAPTDAARNAAWNELAGRPDASDVFVEQVRKTGGLAAISVALTAFEETRGLRPYLDPPSPLHTLANRLASPVRPVRAEAEAEFVALEAQRRDPSWDPRSLMAPGIDEAILDAFREAVFLHPDRIDVGRLPLGMPPVRRWAEDVILARLHQDPLIVRASMKLGGPRIRAALEDLRTFARGAMANAVAEALKQAR